MNNGIKFSIICPAYNCEASLQMSINSIIKQSFSNWELIIVDDGSSDKTSSICDKNSSNDKRIKVIHQENLGQSKARLNGINVATGDYILFLDSDDEYYPEALETINKQLCKEPIKLIVYNASVYKNIESTEPIYNFDAVKNYSLVEEFFLKRRISYFWSICFKKELFDLPKEVLERYCSLSYSEDLYLIYNIVKSLKHGEYDFVDKELYQYNFNENSLTKNQNAKKAVDRFYAFNSVYESIYLENAKEFSNISKDVKDTAGWTYLSAARKMALEYNYEKYLVLIKHIRNSFIFKNMNDFKKDKYNFVGYILLKLKMYKQFRKYIIKKEGNNK